MRGVKVEDGFGTKFGRCIDYKTHFVKNNFFEKHFVEVPNDDKKISGKLLCQKYIWHFDVIPMMFPLNPKSICGAQEVLGD